MRQPGSVTVLIQARLASARLPAKALLPISTMPAVVLCASRAANTGRKVIVATSDAPADAAIVDAVEAAGIDVFGGSHQDVLGRFAKAASALPEDALIVRLTADNLLPDGSFIDSLVREFDRQALDYVSAESPMGGWPYGLRAEAFTAAVLRKADRAATAPFDREHVTPWIKRCCAVGQYVQPERQPHWSRLRCTLDTFEDYEVLRRVFAGIPDPVTVGWRQLLERLAELSLGGRAERCPYRVQADGSIHSLLTLGAAQLGFKYGIANSTGMPGAHEIADLLALAADRGITAIDTASGYGDSEERIGDLLPGNYVDQIRIITKLDVLSDVPPDASAQVVAGAVDTSVYKSLHRLRRRRLDTLLLHRWSHHDAWSGAAWNRLMQLKHSGVVGKLGASVENPSDAVQALCDPAIEHLQCPVNLLDGRWRDTGFLAMVASRPEVVVHARSVLLQGLITLPASRWIRTSGVDPGQLCAMLDELVLSLGRRDRLDLCLAYVAALPWVTSLVVGCENVAQLRANLECLHSPALSQTEVATISKVVPMLPEALLNPARWRVASG